MSRDEADKVLLELLALFPDKDVPEMTQQEYRGLLRALPYHTAHRALQVGKTTWTFFPRTAEFCDALFGGHEVAKEARQQLARALGTPGAELWSDFRSSTGWRVVLAGENLPLGVAEAAAINLGLFDPADPKGTLPPVILGREVDLSLPVDPDKQAIGRGALSLGQAMDKHDPRKRDLPALPGTVAPALTKLVAQGREKLAEADGLIGKLEQQRRVTAEHARYHLEARDELVSALVGDADVPVDVASDAAMRLLHRIATHPAGGTAKALEVFLGACWPDLAPAEFKERREDVDEWGDETRVVGVRLVLGLKAKREAA